MESFRPGIRLGNPAFGTFTNQPQPRGGGMAVAAGGSLCIRNRRLPPELPELLRCLDAPDSQVQLIVCMESHERHSWIFTGPMLIDVPPLGIRETELPRIIRSYADDALAALHAWPSCFSDGDLDWIMMHSATSLSEVEKAAFRIVALKKAMGNTSRAAVMLGMAPVSLTRWLDRRALSTDSVAGGWDPMNPPRHEAAMLDQALPKNGSHQ